MGVEGLTEDVEKPDLAQRVKDAAERDSRQSKEKDEQRKARQVRLGHVEEEKPKAKSKAKAKSEESE